MPFYLSKKIDPAWHRSTVVTVTDAAAACLLTHTAIKHKHIQRCAELPLSRCVHSTSGYAQGCKLECTSKTHAILPSARALWLISIHQEQSSSKLSSFRLEDCNGHNGIVWPCVSLSVHEIAAVSPNEHTQFPPVHSCSIDWGKEDCSIQEHSQHIIFHQVWRRQHLLGTACVLQPMQSQPNGHKYDDSI